MTTPSDKELDDPLFGTLIFSSPGNEKPVQKYCVKVISTDQLGKLKSKLQCISIDVPDKGRRT